MKTKTNHKNKTSSFEKNTSDINDWIKVPLWSQNISIVWKFDRNEHVKWNFESLLILVSIGELNVDWNAIVFCFLKRFNNIDEVDEQLINVIIDKYFLIK